MYCFVFCHLVEIDNSGVFNCETRIVFNVHFYDTGCNPIRNPLVSLRSKIV